MRNELSHIVGVGFIMFKAIKVILYTVLVSTVDGELLLFPVRHYLLLITQYEGQ